MLPCPTMPTLLALLAACSKLTAANYDRVETGMSPQQVAIGLQSFIGMDIGRVRRLVAEAN